MIQHHCNDLFLAYPIKCIHFFSGNYVACHPLQICVFLDGKDCASYLPCAFYRVQQFLGTR